MKYWFPAAGGSLLGLAASTSAVAFGVTNDTATLQPLPTSAGRPKGTGFAREVPGGGGGGGGGGGRGGGGGGGGGAGGRSTFSQPERTTSRRSAITVSRPGPHTAVSR